jgi:hypothetical protein
VNPRAGLDDMEKLKFLPHRDSNSDPSVVQPVASHYTDCAVNITTINLIFEVFTANKCEKSSRAVSRVNSELKYNAAEISSASIISVGSGECTYVESKTNVVRNT